MVNDLSIIGEHLPAMTKESIAKIYSLESITSQIPQIEISTLHVIHAGMYSRTIMIPANVLLTGALIKLATQLIVCGDVLVYIGDDRIELTGYNVIPASAGRKQAFLTKSDTYLTMIFPSNAKDIEFAESEFTDEADLLLSKKNISNNKVIITGE